jgi:chromosome partitioning protein
MGAVITVMNMKGGVGKTTVSANVGGALGIYKWRDEPRSRRVLLIDYDPQFNLSQAYIPATKYFALEDKRKTIISVLQDDGTKLNPYTLQLPGATKPPSVTDLVYSIHRSAGAGGALDLIPSTLDLMYIALGRSDHQVDIIENRFHVFIQEARQLYDLIFIDCHPAGSLITKTALAESDHVLIPVVPEKYAIRGIGLMLDFIRSRKIGNNGPTPHILFNRVPRTGHHSDELAIRANPKFGNYCLKNSLKKYAAFAEPEEGAGFVWTSKKPYKTEAAQNLTTVAKEFAGLMGALSP